MCIRDRLCFDESPRGILSRNHVSAQRRADLRRGAVALHSNLAGFQAELPRLRHDGGRITAGSSDTHHLERVAVGPDYLGGLRAN